MTSPSPALSPSEPLDCLRRQIKRYLRIASVSLVVTFAWAAPFGDGGLDIIAAYADDDDDDDDDEDDDDDDDDDDNDGGSSGGSGGGSGGSGGSGGGGGDDDDDDDDDDEDEDEDEDEDDEEAEDDGAFGSNSDDDLNAARGEIVGLNLTGTDVFAARQAGFNVVRQTSLPNLDLTVTVLSATPGTDPFVPLRALRTARPGALVAPNATYRLDAGPCDDQQCFGHVMIEWPLTTAACGAGVRVGVVDTGINRANPMLAGARIETASFTQSPGSVSTDHGTAIAILLVGGVAGGFAGLVPAAQLYGADVFERIDGEVEATTDALVNALDWLAGRDVDIVNMSLSGPNHPLLEAAINALTARGVLVVAAAGNGGPTAAPAFPGAYSQVLSVSAVDRLMRPYRQANRGDYITFAAPGVNLPLPGAGSRSEWSGTSFASAYLTGVVAEILADNRARDAAGVIRTLQSGALDLGSPGRDAVFGWGLPRYQPSCQ